jgi:hypothetical protein
MRERRAALDDADIREILRVGGEKARERAKMTMDEARAAMKLA